MKNLGLVLAVALFGTCVSCNDDDSSSNNNASDVNEVINTVSQGTWRITSYIEDTVDETSHFSNYNFTFGGNNVLTATGPNTYTGIWSVSDSDNSSDDDSPSNDIDFNIAFTAPATFTDLSDDWDILEHTNTKIRLIDVSGGNGGTDYLTFEKN